MFSSATLSFHCLISHNSIMHQNASGGVRRLPALTAPNLPRLTAVAQHCTVAPPELCSSPNQYIILFMSDLQNTMVRQGATQGLHNLYNSVVSLLSKMSLYQATKFEESDLMKASFTMSCPPPTPFPPGGGSVKMAKAMK